MKANENALLTVASEGIGLKSGASWGRKLDKNFSLEEVCSSNFTNLTEARSCEGLLDETILDCNFRIKIQITGSSVMKTNLPVNKL